MVGSFDALDKELFNYQPQAVAGRSVLITGGTTGIGRATAILLASQGAIVMIFGRHQEELDAALADIRKAGGKAFGLTADVAKPEDIKRVFKEVDQKLGKLDILINNAAIGYDSIMVGNYDDWKKVVEINLLGYMATAHEAILRMKAAGGGHIINIGSMSAHVKDNGSSVYVATKSGVRGFSESLRKETNPMGIKVTLIEPGSVGTDMVSESPHDLKRMQEDLKMLGAEDIAVSVLYAITQPKRCDVIMMQIKPHQQII
jgi:NADP-dependent 3-hydroxy acid dehydrogenase YdfG